MAILSLGRITASALSFGIGAIIARSLGPAPFGLFSIAMVVFGIAVVFAEMGLGMSLVRFIPLYSAKNPQKADYYMQTGFWTLLTVSIIVSLFGLLLAKPISLFIYNKPQLTEPLYLSFLGIVGGILWSFIMATLQAREMFKKYAVLSIIINILKIGIIGIIVWLTELTVYNVLVTQIFVSVLGFLIGMYMAPVKLVGVKGDLKSARAELLHFGKWVFIIDVAVMLFSRVDLLILALYADDDVVGLYSAAYSLICIFTSLTSSVSNVLLPKVAKMTSHEELSDYMKRILQFTLLTALFLLPGFYLIGPATRLVYGETYLASVDYFRIMFIGSIFIFIVEPTFLVVYALNRPQMLALVAIFKLAVSIICNILLIRIFSATGAAIASVITHVTGSVFALYMITKHLKKNMPPSNNSAPGKN